MGHDQRSILSSSLFTRNWVLLSTDLCIFPHLFLRKQTSPSRSCLWSLPLISRKSHTFPLTPLKYPAVNLTPFPKCSSHNESHTPASSNAAQSARLQKAQAPPTSRPWPGCPLLRSLGVARSRCCGASSAWYCPLLISRPLFLQ